MGYTIKIGNAVVDKETIDGKLIGTLRVENVRLDNAPAFGEPTDYTNSRWPSYSGWYDAMEALELTELFLGEDGLMSEHPGCKPFTQKELDIVKKAVADRKRLVQLEPGYGENQDPYLLRGVWLEFWMEWALENCENPAIENS